jgi:hypothetical protein
MPFNVTRSREVIRKTCLKGFAGRDRIKSEVFDATTVTIDGTGRYTIPYGTLVTLNPSNPALIKAYVGAGGANATQTLTETGAPTGGTFTLTYNGATTSGIPYNATAAQVATALNALPAAAGNGFATSGGALPGTPVVITFQNGLGNAPQSTLVANSSGLTGGTTPAAVVTPGTTGVNSTEKIIGVVDVDLVFFDNTSASNEPVAVYYFACAFDTSLIQNYAQYGAAAKAALPFCSFE